MTTIGSSGFEFNFDIATRAPRLWRLAALCWTDIIERTVTVIPQLEGDSDMISANKLQRRLATISLIGMLAAGFISFHPHRSEATLRGRSEFAARPNIGTDRDPITVKIENPEITPEEIRKSIEDSKRKENGDKNMVYITFGLMIVGILQLFVFGYQAYKLKQTVSDSKSAIAASIRSAIAAENAVHAERAWLIFDSVKIKRGLGVVVDSALPSDGYLLEINWKNAGRTPAVRSRMKSDHRITHSIEEIPNFDVDLQADGYSVVGQGTTVSATAIFISDENLRKVTTNEIVIFIYSKVTYYDVFSEEIRRYSETCAQLRFVTNPNLEIIPFTTFRGAQNRCK